ncbi:GNAT family N-acetyltransferase [Microbacterium sp. NPDC091313]
MSRIRRYRPRDRDALAAVCLRTADAGRDATGLLEDDDVWAHVFVLPYLERHPEWAYVVEADDERVVGYLVAAPDTAAFEEWFRAQWWPRFAERWPEPAAVRTRQDGVLRYAYDRGPGVEPFGAEHPAHLHIDLLPETQGQGWGRRLIDRLIVDLRAAGVRGLHLVASADNTGALAFYERLGFARRASPDGVQAFTREL